MTSIDLSDDELLPRCFYRHVEKRPDEAFLIQPTAGGTTIVYSYADVMDQATRMAAHLRSLGLPAGSSIAIVSKNCAHFFMTDLAIWMAGHVSVAIFPTLNAEQIRHILDHSDAKLLFLGKLDRLEAVDRALPAGLPCIAYPLAPETPHPSWDQVVAEYAPIDDRPERSADEAALIIYTSGSTGLPKGVVHSFGAMARAAVGIGAMFGVTEHERAISYLPLAHAMERLGTEVSSLRVGYRVFFAESLDTFLDDLRRARPTMFLSVPRLWQKFPSGVQEKIAPEKLEFLLKLPLISSLLRKKILRGLGLDQARYCFSGSAPLPLEVLRWYERLGIELLEGYATTENFSYSHLGRPGRGRVGYVGQPSDGVQCRLGEDGEVLVKSPASMLGYHKEPELSRQAFAEDGFLRTGDRGEIDDAGRLRITGRLKDLFKTSKGLYVAPLPIEQKLNDDPLIEHSCVMGLGHPSPCAVVQLAEGDRAQAGTSATPRELKAALSARLEALNNDLERSARLQFIAIAADPWSIDSGLLTPTLKIRRAKIEERYGPRLGSWYAQGESVVWEAEPPQRETPA